MAQGGEYEDVAGEENGAPTELEMQNWPLANQGPHALSPAEMAMAMRNIQAAVIRIERIGRARGKVLAEMRQTIREQGDGAARVAADVDLLKGRVDEMRLESKETVDTVRRWKEALRNMVLLAMGLGWLASQMDRILSWFRG
jgi:hypothetical protein